MAANLGCVGLIVAFPIHVGADVGDGWRGGFFRKFNRSVSFGGGRFGDLGCVFVGDHTLIDQLATEHVDGVVVLLVVLDLFGSAVLLVVGIRNTMTIVAVGVDFDDAGLELLAGSLHGDVGLGANFVDVGAVDDVPVHAVGFGALGQKLGLGRGAFLRGAHRVAVIFDDIDHGDLEEFGEVKRLMVGALVDRAITEVAEAAALLLEILEAVGQTQSQWCLTSDNAVATPEVFIWSEEVHGAALAFGAAGLFAEHFGHAFLHAHADGERVTVIAVRGDEVIILTRQGNGADGDGLLADVKVEETADLTALVVLERNLLEAADADHFRQQFDLLIIAKFLIYRPL